MSASNVSNSENARIPIITITSPDGDNTYCEAVSASFQEPTKFNAGIPRNLPLIKAFPKMIKNMEKAVIEHLRQQPTEVSSAYISSVKNLPMIDPSLKQRPLTCEFSTDSNKGKRAQLEDAFFWQNNRWWSLAGVFDGHFGDKVANFASQYSQSYFSEILSQVGGNVHQALELLLDQIQKKIETNPDQFGHAGSTAAISFIDKTTHLVYTATLGDSEANIYRDDLQGRKISIPLSCVRNWGSDKDEKRAVVCGKMGWESDTNPKHRRLKTFIHRPDCKRFEINLNVSRALGDIPFLGIPDKPAVVHKSKITITQLCPGDIVVWACDGLKDFVSEQDIIRVLSNESGDLAQNLVSFALNTCHSKDNVTVVAMKVG